MTKYVVAVYESELAYGGPEEGGWWYAVGSLVRTVKVLPNEDRAYEFCRRLNDKLNSRVIGPNQGKREKSSVLSDGVYEAHVYENVAPTHYPDGRPHYE